ncbi:MAG: protein translocase subunit SecF [Nocardioidaceae bacterium]
MSKLGQLGANLYQGKVSVDFVGRRKLWYAMSAVIVLIAIGALLFRGLNFGIQFRGGVEFTSQFNQPSSHVTQVTNAVVDTGIDAAANPIVVTSGSDAIRVQTKPLTLNETQVISKAITDAGSSEVSPSSIGPTWGTAIAKKALTGLVVFLVLVVLLIWGYFREWRMSASGIVALGHDLVITVGVYALTGFEVTPATVTGLLTILGYSLYDTVVVFDKVRENTRGISTSTRRTYADSANLAVNQTLVRSINTSLAALLPVGAILYVGAFQLGSGPLKDLALALFVGMAAGTYSSIFIATPLLTQLKMREPAMQAQAKRVGNRRAQQASKAQREERTSPPAEPAAPAVPADAADSADAVDSADAPDEPAEPAEPGSPTPTSGAAPSSGRAKTADDGSGGAAVTAGVSTKAASESEPQRPRSSAASKRAQPQRRARSKRGKKR